jgi:hypothetical protein
LINPEAEPGPRNRSIASLLPDDAVGYTDLSLDLPHVWANLRQTLYAGAPALAQLVDVFFQSGLGGAGADFESDFIRHLGSRWIAYARYPENQTGPRRLESTYMIEAARPERLRPTLERWLADIGALLNYEMEKTAVGEAAVYRLRGAEYSGRTLIGLKPLANVCLAGNWLILSRSPDNISAALAAMKAGENEVEQGGEASLGPAFARVRSELSPDRFFEAAFAPEAVGPYFQSTFLKLVGELGGAMGSPVPEFAAAPGAEVWSRYFGPCGAELSAGADALHGRFFLLYPEEQ